MEKQKIIWTVLPNGYSTVNPGNVRLSVFVSPRLSSNQVNPRLTLFEDFLDWPKALTGVDFAVQFGNNAPVMANRVGDAPDSELWKAMFTKDGEVFSYGFPNVKAKTVRSYAARHVEDWVRTQFQAVVAESPIEHPSSTDLATQLEPIMFYQKVEQTPSAPAVITRSALHDDLPLKAAGPKMNRTKVKDEGVAAAVGDGEREGKRTRLQTGNIHPQLDNVLSEVTTPLYTNAMLDLQHLAQEPTIEFKATTLNALDSLYAELADKRAVDNDRSGEPTRDFLQVSLFHRPKQPHITAVSLPTFDFHEACASLSNYPELMRRIGLVIDLEVPASAVTSDRVRLVPVSAGSGPSVANLWKGEDPTDNVRPTTIFEQVGGKKVFRAKPKSGSEITEGLLDLTDDKYSLSNLDIDGAALKMMALANTLRHYAAPDLRPERIAGIDPVSASAAISPNEFASKGVVVESATLPALRTAGISLIKTNQALQLIAKMDRAVALNVNANPSDDDNIILYADDLVKGYRVDVWDSDSDAWHSLCQRRGEYLFERIAQTESIDDEGWIEIGAASAADQNVEELQKSWYVPETITSWTGWSKVAPQPGKKIIQPENPAEDDTWNADPNTSSTDYGLATNFRATPGTLPRLRYGTRYRMRMRIADLAGNGLTIDEAPPNATAASEEILYTRFEPVPAPFFVPKTGIKPGESVEHMVVRSNYNMSASDYANLFGIPLHAAYPSERHIVPPRQAQRPAEEYGRFDDGSGRPRPTDYTTITGNDAFFAPFDAKKAPEGVRPEADLGCPWLPDIALGTTFRGLPGMAPSEILKRAYGNLGSWPEWKPIILRLVEGPIGPPSSPSTESGVEITTVSLPKATLVKARYSSYFEPDELEQMAVWKWLSGSSPVTQQKAADGLMWSITPFRGLTLIHVVQQPIDEPAFDFMKAAKKLGDTFVMLTGRIDLHGPSSSKLDVYAEWDEPIDNLALPGPKVRKKKNLAFQEGVDFDDENYEFPPPPEKKSPAAITKKMKGKGALGVVGAAKSLTSYKVQQTPELGAYMTATSTRKKTGVVKKAQPGVVSKGKMAFAVKDFAEKPDERIRHDFGDTKYRRVSYRGVATSRFREYFLDVIPKETPTYDTLDDQRTAEEDSANRLLTRTGDTIEVDVLNSARPSAPKIRYVIPTFAFDKEERADGVTSKRISGLRIWLDRPWYSSGDGEMLGVVVWPSTGPKKGASSGSSPKGKGGPKAFKTNIDSSPSKGKMVMGGSLTAGESIPERLVPYVTQWGADPIWMAGRLGSLPRVGDFLNPDATDSGLSMAEFPSQRTKEFVSVAAYDVGYDSDRRLWYCDIEVNPHEAYFPFIRLALARYHPKSVVDAHLSRIVTADYIQVTPDRSVTVTYDDADARLLRLSVTGVAYRASAAGQFSSEVEVTVETATGPDGDLEWIPAEGSHTAGIDRIGGLGRKLWDGLWAGEIRLPVDRGSRPMRLVIREFEVLLGDGMELPEGFDIDGASLDDIRKGPKPELRRRLVYADVVEI